MVLIKDSCCYSFYLYDFDLYTNSYKCFQFLLCNIIFQNDVYTLNILKKCWYHARISAVTPFILWKDFVWEWPLCSALPPLISELNEFVLQSFLYLSLVLGNLLYFMMANTVMMSNRISTVAPYFVFCICPGNHGLLVLTTTIAFYLCWGYP